MSQRLVSESGSLRKRCQLTVDQGLRVTPGMGLEASTATFSRAAALCMFHLILGD
jgi:hypothetical protein